MLVGAAHSAFAGVGTSVMRTAEIVPPGEFELKVQADAIFKSNVTYFSGGAGFNLSPHLVTGIMQHLVDIEAFLGVGTTDFQIGAQGHFNLLPDVPGQVGLSFLGGLSFLKDSVNDIGYNAILWTFGVITSKKIPTSDGVWTPYGGYEFEILAVNGPNRFPNTLILGTRWEPATPQPWIFYAEIPIGLYRSIFGISVGVGQTF